MGDQFPDGDGVVRKTNRVQAVVRWSIQDHAVALGVLPAGPRMPREAGSMYYAAVPAKHVRRQ
jgi:hypothetical protein